MVGICPGESKYKITSNRLYSFIADAHDGRYGPALAVQMVCTPVFIPSAGALGNEASAGVHSRSPVRSSPRLRARMERDTLRLLP